MLVCEHKHTHTVSLATNKCSFPRNRFQPKVVSIFHGPRRWGELLAQKAGEITGLSAGSDTHQLLGSSEGGEGLSSTCNETYFHYRKFSVLLFDDSFKRFPTSHALALFSQIKITVMLVSQRDVFP